MSPLSWISDELEILDQRSLRRQLRTVEMTDGGRLTIDGKSLINFSSNNYLGLARHPHVLEAVKQVLDHWGVGATASRLISGTTVIHQDLERALAAYLQREAALVAPAGYMTNLAVITSLISDGDAAIVDRLCHASLIDAVRLSGARLFVYEHANAQDAEAVLKRAATYRRKLLITDSLFSMDGDFAPVKELLAMAQRFEATTMLDEAHALGLWGPQGRGIDADLEDLHADIVVGTLSKALGSQGGFVCGSKKLIDGLINRGRSFIFTTGLSPACVAGAQAALSLIQEDPAPARRTLALASKLREGLTTRGWNILGSQSQIIPILLSDAAKALACAEHLMAREIFAPAIRPPAVHAGECRIRFSVTADHTDKDVEQLLTALDQFPK